MDRENKNTREKSRSREIAGIIFVCISLFLAAALLSYSPDDPGAGSSAEGEISNVMGRAGAHTSSFLMEIFGFSSYAIAIFLLIAGMTIFLHKGYRRLIKPAILSGVFGVFTPVLISNLSILTSWSRESIELGGAFGIWLSGKLGEILGQEGAILLSLAFMLIGLVVTTNIMISTQIERFYRWLKSLLNIKQDKKDISEEITDELDIPAYKRKRSGVAPNLAEEAEADPFIAGMEDKQPGDKSGAVPSISYMKTAEPAKITEPASETLSDVEPEDETLETDTEIEEREYTLPYAELFNAAVEDLLPESEEEMLEKARQIVESLHHFNIDAEVRQITPGPIVTRYELTLAPGVKVVRVVSLSDDLALALKSKGGIRIQAPIPGKAAIGIEVPNKKRAIVYLREILESEPFTSSDQPLTIALGKNTAGEPVVADLAKMPHLLIAGSTGSGKSVCVNTIIASILMKATPDKVRMIMVDPKLVELNIYNSIPHLLTPVVSDPKKAGDVLKWAVGEMERRYRQLATFGVRDVVQYNCKIESNPLIADNQQPLPYIVVIIDEFADLMLMAASEIEESIARLAQMARAVGIHLVLATQRPSADVITGLIKANFPSRIAFKVMQSSNSRIILDQSGADKLLGMGDMLFLYVGKPEAVRLHGAFVSNEESTSVVEFVSNQPRHGIKMIPMDEIFSEDQDEDSDLEGMRDPNARDILFWKAARLVVRNNQGSVSLLQRRLKIGYARAARLIDQLEGAGIVSPYDGSKAREVLVDELYIEELENIEQ